MALIVHIRTDGSLGLEPGAVAPESHALPSSTLERWGVAPGHDFTLATDAGDVVYGFSTFGRRIEKGQEVADHKVLVYEVKSDG